MFVVEEREREQAFIFYCCYIVKKATDRVLGGTGRDGVKVDGLVAAPAVGEAGCGGGVRGAGVAVRADDSLQEMGHVLDGSHARADVVGDRSCCLVDVAGLIFLRIE